MRPETEQTSWHRWGDGSSSDLMPSAGLSLSQRRQLLSRPERQRRVHRRIYICVCVARLPQFGCPKR